MASKPKSKNRRPPFKFDLIRFNFPPVRTLHDMSEGEIRALECEYGCPVMRPAEA